MQDDQRLKLSKTAARKVGEEYAGLEETCKAQATADKLELGLTFNGLHKYKLYKIKPSSNLYHTI